MPALVPPVRPITLAEIEAARGRIAGTCVRTPLVKLELGPGFPDIRLKLENLQPINAYKLRGAANAVAMLSDAERQALPVLCQGAAIRFLLTRLYDWLNTPQGALVTRKDPMEYVRRLRFHLGARNEHAYGL